MPDDISGETIRQRVCDTLACICVRQSGSIDEIDDALISLASRAVTILLVLDAEMRRGPLDPSEVDLYVLAATLRDGALKALKIVDPYRAAPQ
jgi:hypothetical protein